jgi:hypothetical protein
MPVGDRAGAMQTYIVRIHRHGNEQVVLHGIVDEVSSGASTTFRDTAELLRILEQAASPTPLDDGERAPAVRPTRPKVQ